VIDCIKVQQNSKFVTVPAPETIEGTKKFKTLQGNSTEKKKNKHMPQQVKI